MKILQKIKAYFLSLFKKKIDIGKILKSRKCHSEIRKIVKRLEQEAYGEYKWEYRGLEVLKLTEPKDLVREYILISQKKSELHTRERDLVAGIVGLAITKCMNI